MRLRSTVFEKCMINVTEGLGYSQKQSFLLLITNQETGESQEKEIQLSVSFKKRSEATINTQPSLTHSAVKITNYFDNAPSSSTTTETTTPSTPISSSLANSISTPNSDIKSILKKSTPIAENIEVSPSPRSDARKKKVVFTAIEAEHAEDKEESEHLEGPKTEQLLKSVTVDTILASLQENVVIYVGFLVCIVYCFVSHVSFQAIKIIALCYWVGVGACYLHTRLHEQQKSLKKDAEILLNKLKND